MTYEEAKEILCSVRTYFGRCNGKNSIYDALRKSVKALEKQIPKTPKETEKGSFLELDNGTQYEILGLCPNCSTSFIGCVPKHCSACGQAIDRGADDAEIC